MLKRKHESQRKKHVNKVTFHNFTLSNKGSETYVHGRS